MSTKRPKFISRREADEILQGYLDCYRKGITRLHQAGHHGAAVFMQRFVDDSEVMAVRRMDAACRAQAELN